MSAPWRVAVAAGEGVRSALAGRWLSAVLVLLVCWATALPGAVDAATVADLVAEEQRFLAAGGNVLVASNREGGVPALACDRLAEADGVMAAAALTHQGEPATLSAAPGGDVTVFAASATIWRVLGVADSPARDAILPQSIADRLGVRDGDWLHFTRSPGTRGEWVPPRPVRVTVADMSILGDQYTGVLLPAVIGPEAVADACVVVAAPAQLPALRDSLPAALPASTGQVVVQDRLFTGEFTADYSLAYQERSLQWAWVATGALLGLVWLLVRWVRRADDALYATMGADAGTRLVLRGTEWLLLAGLGGVWGVAVGTVVALGLDAPFLTALPYVARQVGAALLLATGIVLLGQARRPRSLLADLKDR
ncbi:MAG TPA: hypothetical protein VKZ67_10290 [Natronosporangium sp.]|nr:hypothetical protein [Natronosporangium sp.]